jgi:hypothetical protein
MASWPSSGGGMTNPMTTAEDIIVGGSSGTPARLAKGTDTHVLTMVSGAVAWAVSASGFSNPMTTAGDIIIGGSSGAAARLAKGTDGKVLTMVAGAVAWADNAAQPLDATLTALAGVTTAANKLIYATGSDAFSTTDLTAFARTILDDADAATVLATIGAQPLDSDLTAIAALTTTSTGRSLLAAADAAAIRTIAGSFANPMTTSQDIIVGGVSGAAGRLAKGSDTQVLTVVSGSVAWANASSGFSNPMTTAGDIIVGGASGTAARLAAGSNGKFLTLSAGTPAWGDAQPLDATLTALAGVTTAANKLIYATGSDTFSTADLTSFARTLLDDADAATMLATLGIDTASAPADANYFLQRNSGNTGVEYKRKYFSFVVTIPGVDGTERIWQAPTNQGVIITGAHGWTNAGTTTLALKIGSTSVTGLSALSLTSTEGTDTAGTAANDMSGDDKLNATLSSTSGVTTVYIRVQGYEKRATA